MKGKISKIAPTPPRLHAPAYILILAVVLFAPQVLDSMQARAQDRPPEREMRTYIPPSQLVSFVPSTPFDQFIEFINPIFERVTGKTVVDPQDRSAPIGVSIAGAYFFDALETVLRYNGLTYRETENFYVIEKAPAPVAPGVAGVAGGAGPPTGPEGEVLATLATREIRIDAVLFNLNLTKTRELGINWNVFFGRAGGRGGQGGAGGGQGGQGGQGAQFFIETEELFDDIEGFVGPARLSVGQLTRLFRLFERENIGETVASPTITVQSGETGRIQVGTDIPIQIQDFSGNTITSFVSTGIIVNVTPTLISQPVADTSGAPIVDFIHMDVQVENSSASVSAAGPIIEKSTAETQVLLLDGEQTIIGGLYSTQETKIRRGIPILKDLPPWFFGLRYIFGYNQKVTTERELIILLQAHMVPTLEARARQVHDENLIEERRERVRRTLRRAGGVVLEKADLPEPEERN